MKYLIGFPLCLIAGIVAYAFPSNGIMISVSEKLPILLSIIMAAIFVRLARGFPAIPYEKIDPSKALIATKAFRKLVKSYIITLSVIFLSIILNIALSTIEMQNIDLIYIRIFSGILALSNSFVILSLISLISSDVIISFIQADMIDEVTGARAIEIVKKSEKIISDEFKVSDGKHAKITKL